jgi:hypothetical protein
MQKETKEPRLVLTGSNNRNYAVDMRSEEFLHLMIAIALMWVLENRRNLNILYSIYSMYTSQMLGQVYLFSVLV